MERQLLSYFNLDAKEDESLINFLNLGEKGADTFVFQFGSHSTKFGLASQTQPFMVPTVIAYPGKSQIFKAQDVPISPDDAEDEAQEGADSAMVEESKIQAKVLTDDDRVQAEFERRVEGALPAIVDDLRLKNAHQIDSKLMKAIKKGCGSHKRYDQTNAINCYDDTQKICFADTVKNQWELHLGITPDKFQLITNPTSYLEKAGRTYLYGTEVSALHATSEFTIRRPVKYGNLAITSSYTASSCTEDLQRILEGAISDKMGLQLDKFKHFSVVLVIPDSFVRHHVRHLLNMLFVKMGFKAAFVHVEAVMSTYAMAAQTACIVDIGSTKTSVCCVDDGVIVNKTIIKKHYGGDDISELLYRFFRARDSLHYFPQHVFYPMQYPYHMLQLEAIKEQFTLMQMSQTSKDFIKTIKLLLKEQDGSQIDRQNRNKKQAAVTQVFFNSSDALLLAPQALFYSELFQCLRESQTGSKQETGDLLSAQIAGQLSNQTYFDPEDLIQDIMQAMMAPAQTQQAQQQAAYAKVKTAIDVDDNSVDGIKSEVSGNQQKGAAADPSEVSQHMVMQESMNLEEMICRSICAVDNSETRKRLASQIILVGGVVKTERFFEWIEETVFLKIREPQFDETIQCVEVLLINCQHQQQYLLQQQLLQAQGLPVEPPTYKVDPRFLSWIGGSVIPKLDSSRDMFVSRNKYVASFINYEQHLEKSKADAIKNMQNQIMVQRQAAKKAQQEAAQQAQAADIAMNGEGSIGIEQSVASKQEGTEKGEEDFNCNMVELTFAQEEGLKKEVIKKLKKERILEGGIRLIREKAAFQW